jgi:hypothetical protein
MSTHHLDETKATAFAERLLGDLQGAAVTLMVSVGHRMGLFDAMAELVPSTSQQIADAAGLNERYVREWLGAMGANVSASGATKRDGSASRPVTMMSAPVPIAPRSASAPR